MNADVTYISTSLSPRDIPFLVARSEEGGEEAIFLTKKLWVQLPEEVKKTEGKQKLYLSSRTQDLLRGVKYLKVKIVSEQACLEILQKQKEALRNTPYGVGINHASSSLKIIPLFLLFMSALLYV